MMNKYKTKIWMVVALVFATASIVGILRARGDGGASYGDMPSGTPSATPVARSHNLNVGGMTNLDGLTLNPTQNTDGLKVGSSTPTLIKNIISGTCNPTFDGTSFSATTSAEFICSVTGVNGGELVFASLPAGSGARATNSGAASVFGGFILSSAHATTSGAIGFTIYNGTGAATTSFTQATTSVQYWVIRN